MNQPLRMSSAASLVLLGSMIAGCAAQHSHVGMASHVDGRPVELGFATRALAAFNANNIPLAIDCAEKAVAKSPADATIRTLLGNAYFAAGRFSSAEAAFRDSLTIDGNQPKVILKLALVEIAQGKDNRAVAMLNDARGLLDASDYGLALALAGRASEAVAVLDTAARQPGADATVRQNLALAHALAGQWDEARLIAGQDVPANQLDARIQQWMQLAKPAHAADQVAAVVGVSPALVDPGQPAQLALTGDEPQQQRKHAGVAVKLAEADRAPVVSPPPVARLTAVAAAKSAFANVSAESAAQPIPAVLPAVAVGHSGIASFAVSALTQATGVLASLIPHHVVAVRPAPNRRVRPAAPVHDVAASHAVVQLGAYASAERVLAAWNGAVHKHAALKAYAPMSARFASPKGTFYRLAVRGFHNVGEAKALCSSLQHTGSACFVRNIQGDAPVNIAMR